MDKEKRNAAARARYRARKAELRAHAIEFQRKWYDDEDDALLYSEIAYEYFRDWGKSYGLIREFKENGII